MSLSRVIEALLFSAPKPLAAKEIADVLRHAGGEGELLPNEFGNVRESEVAAALEQLKAEYIEHERAFHLIEKAEGWQLATDPAFAPWVRQLFPAPKPARLTAPALETLSIIAYRQPITRADVEAIRGVQCSEVLAHLMEKGVVRISGRHDSLGRPVLYGTTKKFLQVFGLKSLRDLPLAEQLEAPLKESPV